MAPLSVAATNELQTHSFPILTAAQVDRVLAWGKQRRVSERRDLDRAKRNQPSVFRRSIRDLLKSYSDHLTESR